MKMAKHFKIQPKFENALPTMDNTFIERTLAFIRKSEEDFKEFQIRKELYEIYQEHKVSDVYVINITEFGKFLNDMLPVYMELHKND